MKNLAQIVVFSLWALFWHSYGAGQAFFQVEDMQWLLKETSNTEKAENRPHWKVRKLSLEFGQSLLLVSSLAPYEIFIDTAINLFIKSS